MAPAPDLMGRCLNAPIELCGSKRKGCKACSHCVLTAPYFEYRPLQQAVEANLSSSLFPIPSDEELQRQSGSDEGSYRTFG